MESFVRTSTILIAVAGLAGCAMEPREGPPAPIVQVTPRDMRAAPVKPAESAPEPAPRPAPPKPKPVKQPTKVYAYQDPGAPPEPPAQPMAPSGTAPDAGSQVAMIAPNARSTPPSAPSGAARPSPGTPGGTVAPTPSTPAPAGQPVVATPPKPKPKPEGPPKATLPQAEGPTAPSSQVARSTLPETAPIAAPSLPAAAQTLAAQAEQQRQSGDYTGAAASLERSLRIAPREPYLWNRLARVRMEQGQTTQAGNLAARSNDLAGKGKGADVKKDNWRIIAESKRRSGDLSGASEAERRAGTD